MIKNYKISMSLNARVLNSNYAMGICLNSLEQLIDTLKNKCGLLLNQDFIKDCTVNQIHVKNDVKINIDNLIDELSIIGNCSKYNKITRDNSITYENTNKYDRLNTVIYGKYNEVVKNKEKYKGLDIDKSDFLGISRIETKFNDWRTVKKYFKTRNLEHIINQKNINYIQLTNILKGQPMEIEKRNINDFKSLTEYSNYCMVKDLNVRYKGDINAIRGFIRTKTSNPKHQYKIIDEVLPIVKARETMSLDNIKQMKEQLKA